MTVELGGKLAEVKVPSPARSSDETTSWRGIPRPAHWGHAVHSEHTGHPTSGGKQRFAQQVVGSRGLPRSPMLFQQLVPILLQQEVGEEATAAPCLRHLQPVNQFTCVQSRLC